MNYWDFEELATDKERINALLRETNARADEIKELKEALSAFQYWTSNQRASLWTGVISVVGHLAILGAGVWLVRFLNLMS